MDNLDIPGIKQIGWLRRNGQNFGHTTIYQKLNHDTIYIVDRPVTSMEAKTIIKFPPAKSCSWPDCFTVEFYQSLQEEITPILQKLFK